MEEVPHDITSELEEQGQAAARAEFTNRARQFSRDEEQSRTGGLLPNLGMLASCVVFGALVAWSIMARGKS